MCGAGSKRSSGPSQTQSSTRSGDEDRTRNPATLCRASIVWTILTTLPLLAAVAGCGTTAVHHIARATKLPEEVRGFLRVVDDRPIVVGIVGEDATSERSIAGYVVLHEHDLAQLIRNTEALLALRAEMRR